MSELGAFSWGVLVGILFQAAFCTSERIDVMQNEELIVDHIDFACKIATQRRRQLGVHIEQSDLESEALFGLVKAGRRFDTSHGVPFSRFVAIRIEGSLEDWLTYRHSQVFSEMGEDERTEEPQYADHRALMQIFTALPARLQNILRLRYWEDLSCYDIAPRIGMCYARVYQLERRALMLLRRALLSRGVSELTDIL